MTLIDKKTCSPYDVVNSSSAMAAFNLFIAISGVVFAFFVLGIHNYLTAHEENSCEMTYMFEYPQYVVSFYAGNYGCHLSLFLAIFILKLLVYLIIK